MRTEHDELGAISVPDTALFGATTVRALENFPPIGPRLAEYPELVAAYAEVKAAAADPVPPPAPRPKKKKPAPQG